MKSILALGAAALTLTACNMTPMTPAPSYRTPIVAEPPRVQEPVASVPSSPDMSGTAPAQPPMQSLPTSASDPCGAQSLQGFVGSVAPQPFPAPGPVRVYAEGDPITMDHNENRVNVVVDAENRQRVVSISCG
ncbi:I78 family peptidase inhibitor [Pararhodobacter marinus]|uniref:I78 family peptidase inhibitor n=1 Tax=Pararhodobacter marinus TaxID=2184063 RepID=UPI003512A87A